MKVCKKIMGIFSLLLLASNLLATPVILYSDLTSAPNTGWSSSDPSRGAVVTIWGKGFGADRGSNYVTVNGVNLVADSDYPELWGQKKPTPHVQRISFHLNETVPQGSGSITVTVKGTRSNEIPFHVNKSKIYFADPKSLSNGSGAIDSPYNDMMTFFNNANPGDVIYLREGVFSNKIDYGQETFYIRNGVHGTEESPIGVVGYPNETAIVDALATKSSSKRTAIRVKNNWYTFSKLSLHGDQMAMYADGVGIRTVGNDTIGVVTNQYGTGTIVTSKDSAKVLGNSVHGGRSGNRLDHGIYVSGCSPNKGVEVAYNHLYDNNVAEGPIIVVNHQDNRCASNQSLKSHYIHSNYVDCSDYRSRAIGIYDQSWDGGGEAEPEPTYVYNNISVSCGIDRWWTALYQNSAHVEWYNNIVYDSHGVGLELIGSRIISSKAKNNIFHLTGNWEYIRHLDGTADISNNVYFGSSGNKTAPESLDGGAILADPGIVLDAANANLTVDSAMLAAGIVDADVSAVVKTDYHGTLRPKEKMSVGAIELNTSAIAISPPSPPTKFKAIPN